MWNCDCLKINKYFKTFHFLFSWSSPSLSPIWCFTIVVVTHVQHVNLCPFCCWQFVVNSICTTYYRTINLERNRQTEKEKDRQCHDKIETTDYDKYDRNMNFLRLNSNSPTTGWTLKFQQFTSTGYPCPRLHRLPHCIAQEYISKRQKMLRIVSPAHSKWWQLTKYIKIADVEVSHTESHYVLSHVHSHTHKHSAIVALRTSTATRTTTTTILASVATITANHIGMLSSHQSCPIYKYIDTLTHTHTHTDLITS